MDKKNINLGVELLKMANELASALSDIDAKKPAIQPDEDISEDLPSEATEQNSDTERRIYLREWLISKYIDNRAPITTKSMKDMNSLVDFIMTGKVTL